MIDNAETVARTIADTYNLTYRCSVNLEGTINNLLEYGLTIEQAQDIVEDIISNFEEI